MTNKNVLIGVVSLLVGLALGWVIFSDSKNGGQTHMMDNNQMDMDMDHAMDSMMSGLNGKTGDEFDKAFLSEMIVHHHGAVDMAEAVLQTSKKPELIKLANDIISAQTKEIEMMQNWQKSWFNNY